ncbi:Uncharacterized protein APZ42_031277 [Daphnia magna]|uniref:Reverse transcriptase domain-containing protein n=1 Tax=Daphnia magna TaxID=35525 RepID=A0A164MZ97_9CRUS|nr:Uncharacterized protein APZ42_031277 [Daphnia magna]
MDITGPNSFALQGHPFVETSWLRTATEKMTNCRLEEATLQSECPNCTISSPLGDIPEAISGSFKHNLVTLIWDDSWKEAKPCELRVIEKGMGVKYSTEKDTTFRNRDPIKQLDFIYSMINSFVCGGGNLTAYHPVLGMDSVVIAVREATKETDLVEMRPNNADAVTKMALSELTRAEIEYASHTQYIRNLAMDILNHLAREIRNLQCESRKTAYHAATTTAQYDGWLAAKHLDLPLCIKLLAVGASVSVLQCFPSNVTFETVFTPCGGQPRPQKSETFERCKFVSRRQAVEEPFDKFLLALKGLISSCNYDTQRDSLLRDQIVVGIIDNDTREPLLSQSTLDLKKAVEICRARESAWKHAVRMQSGTKASQTQMLVNLLNANRGMSSSQKMQNPKDSGNTSSCRFCGGQHSRGKCPAYGKFCVKCRRINHFAKVCEQSPQQQSTHGMAKRFDNSSKKSLQQQTPQSKNCDSLQTDSEVTVREFIISSISNSKTDDSWFVTVSIDGVPVDFKVDTGAQCNVLPRNIFDKVVKLKQLKPGPKVTAYNRQPVRVVGQQQLHVVYNSGPFKISCVVAEDVDVPVLGLPSCKALNVVKLVDSLQTRTVESGIVPHQDVSMAHLLDKYESVFKGIGKLPMEHRIQIQQSAVPVVHPARRIPFKLRGPVLDKLSEMEQLGLIVKVSDLTDWVSPMVVARKSNGDIRICLDPADLNGAIKRQHYQVPSAQEIFSRNGKAKYFSTLDATSGFLQVPLGDESTSLTTMATPFGRYKFLRLPFG